MKYLFKPLSEKKTQLKEPLVEAEQPSDVLPPKVDVESGPTTPPHSRRMAVWLFLLGLLAMSIGIAGGIYFYPIYARRPVERLRGIFNVPYNNSEGRHLYYFDPSRPTSSQRISPMERQNDYFTAEIETDGLLERIVVPDFHGGRKGLFIHDFEVNKTVIVDLEDKRCFVMPLNRRRVLPPRSLLDLIRKTLDGSYNVDTDVVRETMRVEVPPISNMDGVGKQIARECSGKKTYALVKVNSPVVKRSAENPVVYAQFAGSITEFDITNFPELIAYEEREKMLENVK